MERVDLRLEILKLTYVKGISLEANLATVREVEKQLFGESEGVGMAEEVSTAVKRGRPPKSKVADNSTEALL